MHWPASSQPGRSSKVGFVCCGGIEVFTVFCKANQVHLSRSVHIWIAVHVCANHATIAYGNTMWPRKVRKIILNRSVLPLFIFDLVAQSYLDTNVCFKWYLQWILNWEYILNWAPILWSKQTWKKVDLELWLDCWAWFLNGCTEKIWRGQTMHCISLWSPNQALRALCSSLIWSLR